MSTSDFTWHETGSRNSSINIGINLSKSWTVFIMQLLRKPNAKIEASLMCQGLDWWLTMLINRRAFESNNDGNISVEQSKVLAHEGFSQRSNSSPRPPHRLQISLFWHRAQIMFLFLFKNNSGNTNCWFNVFFFIRILLSTTIGAFKYSIFFLIKN